MNLFISFHGPISEALQRHGNELASWPRGRWACCSLRGKPGAIFIADSDKLTRCALRMTLAELAEALR
jgi:hypothetical protein